MSSRNHWRANTLLTVAGALLIAWQTAGAQGDYTISDNVDLVLLDASVKDVRGGFVTGLARGDFRVYEDGHERAITHFAPVDAPVRPHPRRVGRGAGVGHRSLRHAFDPADETDHDLSADEEPEGRSVAARAHQAGEHRALSDAPSDAQGALTGQ